MENLIYKLIIVKGNCIGSIVRKWGRKTAYQTIKLLNYFQ